MNQFEQELPKLSPKEQLQQIVRTHEMNLKDLKSSISNFSHSQEIVHQTYFRTLESDIEITKHIIDKL